MFFNCNGKRGVWGQRAKCAASMGLITQDTFAVVLFTCTYVFHQGIKILFLLKPSGNSLSSLWMRDEVRSSTYVPVCYSVLSSHELNAVHFSSAA